MIKANQLNLSQQLKTYRKNKLVFIILFYSENVSYIRY